MILGRRPSSLATGLLLELAAFGEQPERVRSLDLKWGRIGRRGIARRCVGRGLFQKLRIGQRVSRCAAALSGSPRVDMNHRPQHDKGRSKIIS